MTALRYHGPFAEVDVPLVGRLLRRGETFEATDEQAARLLAQPDNFEPADEPEPEPVATSPEPDPKPKKPGTRRPSTEDKA